MGGSTLSRGVAWNDFDADGDPDLAVGQFTAGGCRIFRNDRAAGFVDASAILTGFAGADSQSIGLSWADSDEDGDLDLFLGQFETLGLVYRNDGTQLVRRVQGDLGTAVSEGRTVIWVDAASYGDAELAFALPGEGRVELSIYDVTGRLVRRLVEGPLSRGIHRYPWDGRNSAGSVTGAGLYFAKLSWGADEEVVKIVRVK